MTPAEINAWLKKNLHALDCPHAYLGDEPNSFHRDWEALDFRVCLAGAMSYLASEGNLALPLIYSELNHAREDWIVERTYFPTSRKEISLFKKEKVPPFSLESRRPLKDFDVIAFSISYIMPYLHIPFFMDWAGIPVYANDRAENDPFVVVGGCMSYCCEILAGGNGGVYDFAYIGESEGHFVKVLEFIKAGRGAGKSRDEILYRLATTFEGIYVPKFYDVEYDSETKEIKGRSRKVNPWLEDHHLVADRLPERIKKAWTPSLDSCFIATDPFVSFAGGMAMGHVEISRGCSNSCHFCQEGFNYRPYRERSVPVAVEALKATMRNTGAKDVIPSAFTSSDHHQRNLLVKRLLEEVTSDVHIISQRADAFGSDPLFAELTAVGGSHTVSIGMEGVSQRVRDVLNKCITEEHLLLAITHAIRSNYTSIKLFMIANVPGTIDSDYEELMTFLDKVIVIRQAYIQEQEEIKAHDRNAKVIKCEIKLSFTPLFISAFTPFQWYGATIEERNLTSWIPKIKEKGFGFRLGSGARFDEAFLSQLFHLGDRRLTEIIVKEAIEGEFLHFGGTSKGRKQKWDALLAEQGLSFEYYLGPKRQEFIFPWDFINNRVGKKALWKQYQNSIEASSTRTPCIRSCYDCGACPPEIKKEREDWQPDLKEMDTSTLQIVKQRMQSREFMWVRGRFVIDAMHRTVPKDHWVHQVRRAAYLNDYPIDKSKVSFASDKIQLFNWISGLDYVDLGFLEQPPKTVRFIEEMNRHLSGAKFEQAARLGRADKTKKLRGLTALTWYVMPLDRDPEEVAAKIVAFLGLPPVPSDVKIPNDPPGTRRENKVPREEKAAFMKAYPTVGRIQKKSQRGVIRIMVDLRPLIDDMWVTRSNGPELHMLVRGGVSPYDVFKGVMRTTWKAGISRPAFCVETVDLTTYDGESEDFFSAQCEVCGATIQNNLIGTPLHDRFCIKHLGRESWDVLSQTLNKL